MNWSEVVAAALVGTDRRPVDGGAGALLDTAAELGLRKRAGTDAAHGVTLPEAAPEEGAQPASRVSPFVQTNRR